MDRSLVVQSGLLQVSIYEDQSWSRSKALKGKRLDQTRLLNTNIEYDDSNNNAHYYDEDCNNSDTGDANGEYNNDFQDEQIEDDTEGYEDWDDRDEYHWLSSPHQ